MINAKEDRKMVTCDIPGAFMQVNINEQLFLKFDGDLVELLIQVDPTYQLTEFRQPLQVKSHLEMPGILVQLGHIQRT